MKKFFQSKEAKRALWTIVNSLMSLFLAYLTYLTSDNVSWAITVLPLAQAFSQYLTKTLNGNK